VKLPASQIDLLGTAYDYDSAMHYGAYAFAVDTSIPTIIPHDPEAVIGQRNTLSALDIERVQIFYGCLAAVNLTSLHIYLIKSTFLKCFLEKSTCQQLINVLYQI